MTTPIIVTPALQSSLVRLAALEDYPAAKVAPLEAGWFSAADLLRPDLPYLDEGLAWSVRRYPKAEQRVGGLFLWAIMSGMSPPPLSAATWPSSVSPIWRQRMWPCATAATPGTKTAKAGKPSGWMCAF